MNCLRYEEEKNQKKHTDFGCWYENKRRAITLAATSIGIVLSLSVAYPGIFGWWEIIQPNYFEKWPTMGNCHHHKKNLWSINLEPSGNCHQLRKSVGNEFWISGQLPNCHHLDTPLNHYLFSILQLHVLQVLIAYQHIYLLQNK